MARWKRNLRPYAYTLGALLLLAYPFLVPSPYYASLVIHVYIMAIYALSFDLLLGHTGLLSLGHTLFFGLGAYGMALFALKAGWPMGLAFLMALLLAAVASLLFGALSLRVTGLYFAMVTLAFAEIFHLAAEKLSRLTGGADGLTGIPVPAWLQDRTTFYYGALLLLAFTLFLLYRLFQAPVGSVWRAIRENERRAQ
ncbi:MAG: branched-chain amino acid ABC transporter permease, partial [Bacillota bacterium]|nr:branched-chain amino acid ABC transporter permease [Bacillota bacterium]